MLKCITTSLKRIIQTIIKSLKYFSSFALTNTLIKMFTNKNESMKKGETTAAVNMIGAGTVITGDVFSKGDIRVDGTLKGSVITEGKVVLGREGIIEGDIECKDADISGTIKAKISVSQLLSLKATAKLNGDIITNKLSIEP